MAQQKINALNSGYASSSSSMQAEARFTAQQQISPHLGRMTRAARNGSLATAPSLGTFPPGQRKFKNALSQQNPVDFFKIELTAKGRIKLALTNRSETAITASILNANGQVVSVNGQRQLVRAAAGTEAETLIKSADPGVYYLRFKGVGNRRSAYEASLFVNRPGLQPLPCGCGS